MLCENKMLRQGNTMTPFARESMSNKVKENASEAVALAAEHEQLDRFALFADRRKCRNRRVNDNAFWLKRSNSCQRKKSSNRRRSFDLNKDWYLKTSYVDQDDRT
jgi:hypothetical protein